MSSYDVTLSSATRQNLLSLQDTTALTATNQQRLSTGKKVNSALDNPVNFFTAQGLNGRASTLNGLLDGISNGIQTIQAANQGITSITSLVKQLQSTITQAQTNAAANHASATGATSIGTGTTGGAATTQSGAASMTMVGAGGLGMTAGDTITFGSGPNTFTYTASASDTVQNFVNAVNSSGVASASISSTGALTVTGTSSSALTIKTTDATGTAPNQTSAILGKLGFSTAQQGTAEGAGIAASVSSSTVRSSLVTQFNNLTQQIDSVATDSGYNGINLLAGNNLDITFNEKTGPARSHLNVAGQVISSSNLGVTQAVDGTGTPGTSFNIQNDSDLSGMQTTLTNVLTNLQSIASNLGSSLSTVQTRQDFTKQLTNVLTTGADNLTDADMNAEAANSQALSTRNSLGISALSLANTAQQGILQLLR